MVADSPENLFGKEYDTKRRFISYWHQIFETTHLRPSSILEVGIGTTFVSSYLRKLGFQVITVDIARGLSPNIVSSILKLPFGERTFDVCLCCEVLEHLPFDNFQNALLQMHHICRSGLILSLPDSSLCLGMKLYAPVISFQTNVISPPNFLGVKNVLDNCHYWEIGKKNYELKRIKKIISISGFKIKKTYRPFENPYHRFFVLEREN